MPKNTPPAKGPPNLPVLTEFVVGKTSFISRGFSTIKLTIDGEEKPLRLPIKSIGVAELQKELLTKEPDPPEKTIVVTKDSEAGKKLGLTEDKPVLAPDVGDPDYLRAIAEFRQEFSWRIMVQGLDCTFVDEKGEKITDPDIIIQALKASGITKFHLEDLLTDINNLTSKREAKADFLSGNTLV